MAKYVINLEFDDKEGSCPVGWHSRDRSFYCAALSQGQYEDKTCVGILNCPFCKKI